MTGIGAWRKSDQYICRQCGSPAMVNPEDQNEWGCTQCGGSTHALFLNFVEGPASRRIGELGYIPCPYVFGDVRCGYVGPELSCNKSPDDCRRLGRLLHFGGSAMLSESAIARRGSRVLRDAAERWLYEDTEAYEDAE